MRSPDSFSIFMGVVIIFFIVSIRKRLSDQARSNFETLGKLLNTAEKKFGLSQARISGLYKGRKVSMVCGFLNKDAQKIFMFPQIIPNPQKLFMLSYPRPTEHTEWKGSRVQYLLPQQGKESVYKVFSEEEFREILEELSKAASRVESGIALIRDGSHRG